MNTLAGLAALLVLGSSGCYVGAGFGGGAPVTDSRPGAGSRLRLAVGMYAENDFGRIGAGPDVMLVSANGDEKGDFSTVLAGGSVRADWKIVPSPEEGRWGISASTRLLVGDALGIDSELVPDRGLGTSLFAGVLFERKHDRELFGGFSFGLTASRVGLEDEDALWFAGAMFIGEITFDREHIAAGGTSKRWQ